MRTADVIVVGGGAIGGAVAWSLAREGARVALLERDGLASRASGAAAGMLIPVGEGRAPGAFLRWGLRSLALFPEVAAALRDATGIDVEYEPSGALYLAASQEEALRLRARAEALPGLDLEWLDAAAARDAEPRLAAGIAGALWSPREAHVRSPLLARAYAAAAEALGARVETGAAVGGLLRRGSRVVGVRTPAGEWQAPQVVLCTGAWAGDCAGWIGGEPLPVEPLRGQIACLEAPRPAPGRMLVAESAYLVPKRDGSLVVGATEERVGFDCRVTAGGVAGLLAAARRVVPVLADAGFRSAWAGLRPASPDGLPLVGAHPGVEGLAVAVGHTRNGVLLSPVTGRLVADLLLGKEVPADASAFSPLRFGEAPRR